METCSNPGCDQPGTNKCGGCKTTPYCGPTCQKTHWNDHKESCDGRLRKIGMSHLDKVMGFHREKNWAQTLRYSDLAATKLKQLKDRPIDDISAALCMKYNVLCFLGQHREQLECAKEWYCLWNTKPTDVGAIDAAIALIQSSIQNNQYADAVLYASTLWEIINHKHDNKIPDNQRQHYIADGAHFLALATLHLAQHGGIPPEEKKKTGEEAIALAHRALEIHTQLHGTENDRVAKDMSVLADLLAFFNGDDDDEVLRLYQQANAILARLQGRSSLNVAIGQEKLSHMYHIRAMKARAMNDRNLEQENLQLALSYCREGARIYRDIGRVEKAAGVAQLVIQVEEELRQIANAKATAAASRG